MAQCKECLHYGVCAKEGRLVQVDEHTWDEYNLLPNVEQFCTSYFTADVVPKSEVDRLVDKWIGEEGITQDAMVLRLIEALRDEAKRYEKYYFNHEYDKLIAEAKQEVAREIFEEIRNTCGYSVAEHDGVVLYHTKCYSIMATKLDELEKKYTESEGKE